MLELVEQLKDNNISIWVNEDKVKLAYADDSPVSQFLDTIKHQKAELLQFLRRHNIDSELAFENFKSSEKKAQKNNIEAIFPANSLQQGFIYHYLTQPQDDAYRVQLLWDYHCELNLSLYQQAWKLASQRYPILRTAFNWEGQGEVLQVITSEPGINDSNFNILDISELDIEKRDAKISEYQRGDRKVAFDLTRPGLIRLTLIKQNTSLWSVIKTEHHSICDGWGGPILLQTVHQYYNQLIRGETPKIIVESAYLETQAYYLKQKKATENYWFKMKQEFLSANDVNLLLSHPIDLTQTKSIDNPEEKTLRIHGNEYFLLKSMCQKLGITLNVALQFAWHKLIQCYTQDQQTIVGTTVSGRDIPIKDVELSVGLYINTLPLSVDWEDDKSSQGILLSIQSKVAEINTYSSIPLASLNNNGEPLFHSLFVFENYPIDEMGDGNPEAIENKIKFRQAIEKVDYPLLVTAFEERADNRDENDSLTINLSYGERWLSSQRAERLLNQLQRILLTISNTPDINHQLISLIDDKEKNQLINCMEKREDCLFSQTTIPLLFEEQVKKHPSRAALTFAGKSLSYAELNQKSDQLAVVIRHEYQQVFGEGLKANTLIALYLDRSLEMVISILAVLKAGGAYVPISPDYPEERSLFILEDTSSPLVITQRKYFQRIKNWKGQLNSLTKIIDSEESQPGLYHNKNERLICVQPNDLAYVIYTSGTTGQPKGVLQPHQNVCRLFSSTEKDYQFNHADCWTLFHAYTFDFSVWEIWGALLYGGHLVIPEQECIHDVQQFIELCSQYQVSVLNQTPEAFYSFLNELTNTSVTLPCLRYIIFGGDKLNLVQLKPWWERHGGQKTRLINMYGITETTVHVTYQPISREDCLAREKTKVNLGSPIGKPLLDLEAYVLDSKQQLVPIGMPGELYVGGAGLAQGYLNRQELTQQRFITNPFLKFDKSTENTTVKDKKDSRLYRTGDKVRWLENGELEYLGRTDQQVKIRGYRIELGEIEACLSKISGVKQAVVIDCEHRGHKYLAAYYVVSSGYQGNVNVLREKLLAQIPDYMIPTTFTQLDNIPLTINGKLNRLKLPLPEFDSGENYVAARNALEDSLCDVWQRVLELDKVGIYDNFFRIGGDSIIAIRLIAQAKISGLNFTVHDLFLNPNIASLAALVKNHDDKDELDYKPLSLLNEQQHKHLRSVFGKALQDAYPATQLQTGMLIESSRDLGVYHDVFHYPIHQALDRQRIINLIQQLSQRHEVLRTGFYEDAQDGYIAFVVPEIDISVEIIDKESSCDAITRSEHSRPFRFSSPGLFRFLISEVKASCFRLTFSFHHAILDGWSVASLIKELMDAYTQRRDSLNNISRLPSYAEYSAKETAARLNPEYKQFWRDYLSGYEGPAIPLIENNQSQDKSQLELDVQLSLQQSGQLINVASQMNLSADNLFLSLYYDVLCLFQNTDDLTIGLVVNNRLEKQGGDQLLGLFLNTIPFRPQKMSQPSREIITRVKHIAAEKVRTLGYKHLPYSDIKEHYQGELYQCVFNYVHFHVAHNLPALSVESETSALEETQGFEKTNIPFVLSVSREGNRFSLSMKAHAGCIKKSTMQQLLDYLLENIQQVCQYQQSKEKVAFIDLSERDQLRISQWKKTQSEYLDSQRWSNKQIHQIFEQQVSQSPEHIAVTFRQQSLNYQQLNEKSNQWAQLIRDTFYQRNQKQLLPDTIIGIYLDRSIDMVIAILAVLKAGAAYLPLATSAPKDRVVYMLKDAEIDFVLSHRKNADTLNQWRSEIPSPIDTFCMDDESAVQAFSTSNFNNGGQPADLAYIIYTSGTTGNPKGVMIEHAMVTNLVQSQVSGFEFGNNEISLWLSEYIFDASVEVLFLTLCTGGQLIIPSQEDIRSPLVIKQQIVEHKVTHLVATSSYLSALGGIDNAESIRRVVSGGEKCTTELKQVWRNKLINEYGPTEATVTTLRCDDYSEVNIDNRIGKPIENIQVYVLSDEKKQVPVGAPGELYISGAGVARGYLNQPELTQQSFINNPYSFQGEKDQRLYKTGDMVRWLDDGSLVYLGRKDRQVKVSGYRIELSEIESQLLGCVDIKQAHVTAKKKAKRFYLVAYVVLSENSNTECLDEIKKFLSTKLPAYMQPEIITPLDAIPLNQNGKVDYQQLPDVALTRHPYVAPVNDIEKSWCEIWQTVLAVKRVGITDSFFAIGGNSMTAIRLIAALSHQLNIDVPLALLFEQKTISAIISRLEQKKQTAIKPTEMKYYPLSFSQQRLLFIEQFSPDSFAYHIPELVMLKKDTNLDELQRAFYLLRQRHTALRTVFTYDEQASYQQVIEVDNVIPKSQVEGKEALLSTIKNDIQTTFDLTCEPGFRLNFYQSGGGIYLLMLWHHIVFDGWSADIFMQELATIYSAICHHNEPRLPVIDISYQDYAVWQREVMTGAKLENLKSYWQRKLSGYQTLDLLTDYPRPATLDYNGKNYFFSLDSQLSKSLRELAQSQETTLFTILLSGFYITLANLSGQTDILIGTPSDNRHHKQTQSLIGFFVNSLVLRSDVDCRQTISQFIGKVHQLVVDAKVHQELPFEKLIELLDVERDPSRHPLYQVMFSLESFKSDIGADTLLPFETIDFGTENIFESPAKFDLSLQMNDSEQLIAGGINYASSLFNQQSIERLAAIFQRILIAMVSNSQQQISKVSLVSATEMNILCYQWNQTERCYTEEKLLHQQFEQQVKLSPDRVALVFNQQKLTYMELNVRANQLSHYISHQYHKRFNQPISADTLIALYLDKSIEMIVSILAVLKTGAAYVPISPDYPKERVRYILNDTQTPILISHEHYLRESDESSVFNAVPLHLNVDDKTQFDSFSHRDLALPCNQNQLAYVIYTSGTTGKPKGVMVEHQAACNTILAMKDVYQFDQDFHRATCFSDYVFDVSVSEIFNCLNFGGELHLFGSMIRKDVQLLSEYITENAIHYIFLPPAILSVLPKKNYSSLKAIVFAGEKCDPVSCSYWHKNYSLYNFYGPTEAAIYASGKLTEARNLNEIGRPLSNVKLFVLNKDKAIVPIGVPGELYIGGAGLSRGYLNDEVLTRERFIEHYIDEQNQIATKAIRIYKTGDKVRWLPDNNLEYLGRIDQQVKIRGYRIELGEIEAALNQLDTVEQAVVIERKQAAHAYLAAYVIVSYQTVFCEKQLRRKLAEKLPAYMLPTTFTQIDEIPKTINGKIDTRSLPQPEVANLQEYRAPETSLEKQLTRMWQSIFERENIGIDENFFHMGGNSINAIQLVYQVNKQCQVKMPVSSLFIHPTIALLANEIESYNSQKNTLVHFTPGSQISSPLFMIHPGISGCEVYQSLAECLSDKYNCFGIDNYNLNTQNKINSLSQLAGIYVDLILSELALNDNKLETQLDSLPTVRLLGWSLGGMIALEIASILEKKGFVNIKVVLLDTLVKSYSLKDTFKVIDIAKRDELLVQRLREESVKQVDIDNILLTKKAEDQLESDSLTKKLTCTQVILLKAAMNEPSVGDIMPLSSCQKIRNTYDNDVSKLTRSHVFTRVVNNRHHGDILEEKQLIKEMLNKVDFLVE